MVTLRRLVCRLTGHVWWGDWAVYDDREVLVGRICHRCRRRQTADEIERNA